MYTFSIEVEQNRRIIRYCPRLCTNSGVHHHQLGKQCLTSEHIRAFFGIDWSWDDSKSELRHGVWNNAGALELTDVQPMLAEVQEKVYKMMAWAVAHEQLYHILGEMK